MAESILNISQLSLSESQWSSNENFSTENLSCSQNTPWTTPVNEKPELLVASQDSGYRTEDGEDEMDCSQSQEDKIGYTNIRRQSNGGDYVNIHNNNSVVIVNLGKLKDDEGRRNLTPSRRMKQTSVKRYLSFNKYDDHRRKNRVDRRLMKTTSVDAVSRKYRQKKISFRQCKRQINLKSPTRGEKKKADKLNYGIRRERSVNIEIKDNNGAVVVGENMTFSYSRTNRESVKPDGAQPCMAISPSYGPVVHANKDFDRKMRRMYSIIEQVYPLRENGRWDAFYKDIDDRLFAARNGQDTETEIFLTIEKGIGLSYQKRDDESLNLVNTANQLITKAPNLSVMREFLLVLSHCQLAALYRRQNRLLDAMKAVFEAQQNAAFVPSLLAKAYLSYETASNQALYLSLVSTKEPEREGQARSGKADLKECISISEKFLQENNDVYLKKHIFALTKLALMNLNCRTPTSRTQPVSQEDICEAADSIQHMQKCYSDDVNGAITVQLETAICDLYFRQGQYTKATLHAQKALNVSQAIGFTLESPELQNRIKEMSEII